MTGERLLTIPEAAERLRISTDWLYRVAGSGDIAVMRLGQAMDASAADAVAAAIFGGPT